MPFIKRRTVPVNVSQVKLENGVKIDDDLEWIANHTLCSIIQQLSNLNNSASCLFGELCNEARAIHNKTNNLKSKVDEMKERYKRWNKIKGGGKYNQRKSNARLHPPSVPLIVLISGDVEPILFKIKMMV